jgi:hypothetical protein
MKKLLKIVLVGCVPLFLFSCYYDEFPKEEEVVIPPETQISFSSDITPIFVAYNCAQCHKPSGQSPDLTEGNEYNALVPTYVTAGDAINSRLYIQLAVNNHRNVDATSIALIEKWIDDGAENN